MGTTGTRAALSARALVVAAIAALLAFGGARFADADPIGAGSAASFGVTASLAGNEVIPPTPKTVSTAPPFGDDQNQTAIPIDAAPLAVNGTLIASTAIHEASDLTSDLVQVQQDVAGPYNAKAVGQVEDLEVLVYAVEVGVPLVRAELIRGEAVAVCSAGAVHYSANSEVVNLSIGGQDPLSGPLNDIIAQLEQALEPLAPLVDLQLNVVTTTATGASVDAVVISVLSAADPEAPVVQVRLGHAELTGVGCGSTHVPECSDTADNDGDGVIDADDPGCHTDGNPDNPDSYDPNDDSEAEPPQCSDTVDNDGDGVIDKADPGCHADGNAANDASYDANDDDETNQAVLSGGALPKTDAAASAALPTTGGEAATGLGAALGLGAVALFALRRRLA